MNHITLITNDDHPESLYNLTDLDSLQAKSVSLHPFRLFGFQQSYHTNPRQWVDKARTFIVDCHLLQEDELVELLKLPNLLRSESRILLRNWHVMADKGDIQNRLHSLSSAVAFQLFNPLKHTLGQKCSSYACTPGYASPMIAHVMEAAQTYGKTVVDSVDRIQSTTHGRAQIMFRYGSTITLSILKDKERTRDQDQGYVMGDGAVRQIDRKLNAEALADLFVSKAERFHRILSDALFTYKIITK
ncbi:hypothetical protein Peetri_00176 [Pseudomonas phage vB_PpuM-Peetri]